MDDGIIAAVEATGRLFEVGVPLSRRGALLKSHGLSTVYGAPNCYGRPTACRQDLKLAVRRPAPTLLVENHSTTKLLS